MNILLIYPEFPDTFWSFKYALKFVRKKASLLPLMAQKHFWLRRRCFYDTTGTQIDSKYARPYST